METRLRTQDFDYDLPPELVAYRPAPRRTESRLMVLDRGTGEVGHTTFGHIAAFLRAGDLLVVNDTKVIKARLKGQKKHTGGAVEILALREIEPTRWEVLVSPSRRVHTGTEVDFGGGYSCRICERLEGAKRVARFSRSVSEVVDAVGTVPLPPYIKREPEDLDLERYQTVFASKAGSVAAPTAGLHFSGELIGEILGSGISISAITLHVGRGTFVPVRDDDPRTHVIEPEYYEVDADCCRRVNEARGSGGRIVAVGTTAVRALETAAEASGLGSMVPRSGWTRKYILPPYDFKAVDALVTNFHMPRSTLLMLVSAFAGRDRIMKAYREAVRERYRFYSYGDAMLIL